MWKSRTFPDVQSQNVLIFGLDIDIAKQGFIDCKQMRAHLISIEQGMELCTLFFFSLQGSLAILENGNA